MLDDLMIKSIFQNIYLASNLILPLLSPPSPAKPLFSPSTAFQRSQALVLPSNTDSFNGTLSSKLVSFQAQYRTLHIAYLPLALQIHTLLALCPEGCAVQIISTGTRALWLLVGWVSERGLMCGQSVTSPPSLFWGHIVCHCKAPTLTGFYTGLSFSTHDISLSSSHSQLHCCSSWLSFFFLFTLPAPIVVNALPRNSLVWVSHPFLEGPWHMPPISVFQVLISNILELL